MTRERDRILDALENRCDRAMGAEGFCDHHPLRKALEKKVIYELGANPRKPVENIVAESAVLFRKLIKKILNKSKKHQRARHA